MCQWNIHEQSIHMISIFLFNFVSIYFSEDNKRLWQDRRIINFFDHIFKKAWILWYFNEVYLTNTDEIVREIFCSLILYPYFYYYLSMVKDVVNVSFLGQWMFERVGAKLVRLAAKAAVRHTQTNWIVPYEKRTPN